MWNPYYSSYKIENFERDFQMLIHDDPDTWFNWSVHEYEKADIDDRFFLVKVGQEGATGVVMSGYFSSEPYQDEDWSGKNRTVYYMDMEVDVIIHPEKAKLLPTEMLIKNIPEFDWTGGHSGRLIEKELAKKLEKIWTEFLFENKEMFNDPNKAWFDKNTIEL